VSVFEGVWKGSVGQRFAAQISGQLTLSIHPPTTQPPLPASGRGWERGEAASAADARWRRVAQALAVALAGLAFLTRVAVGPLTIDDAYITFRYARNLADGLGFVYNAGQRVLGTTTPLYTIVLAAIYQLGGVDVPRVSLILAASADAATTLLLIWLGNRLGSGRAWAALLGALFALSPLSITYAVGGMESSLFTLLVVGAAAADVDERPGLAGLLAGLATLTRPEGLLIAALVLGRHLVARHLPPRRAIVAFLAPVLPWVVFACWWFGSPIPQSVSAKAVAYQHLPPFANALWLLVYMGLPGSSPSQLLLADPPVPGQVGLLVSVVLVLLTLPFVPRLVRRLGHAASLWPLAGFGPLLAAAYALAGLRGVPMFQWYLVPLVPFFLLWVVALLRWTTRRMPKPAALAAGAVLIGWTVLGLSLGRDAGHSALAPLGVSLAREDAYAAAGRFLAPRLTPNAVVALPEIGAFGYVANARILDTVGLVSPEATRFYPLPPGFSDENAVPPELIRAERPDFIVGHDRYLQAPLVDAPWFRRDYRLIATFPAPIWDGKAVLVYERVGTAN